MPFLEENFKDIKKQLDKAGASLVAVSKFKSKEEISAAYAAGQREFGENYVQELLEKHEALPNDIHWHFIGHLQTNKVKTIAPFVHLIQGVDSEKLLAEINKQGEKLNRPISCLLQMHIAEEESKFGFDEKELTLIDAAKYPFVVIKGLMGMATFTEDTEKLRKEFRALHRMHSIFKTGHPEAVILSMGMSGDFAIALEEGSNMVRIGSLIFGERAQAS